MIRETRLVEVVIPTNPAGVDVLACDVRWTKVDVAMDRFVLRLSGPPSRVAGLARKLLDAVLSATDSLGDTCGFCGQRGLNNGQFAMAYGGGYAHLGCLEDHRHKEGAVPAECLDA
jgi:hypothetical protein